jgi:hypothetical protein
MKPGQHVLGNHTQRFPAGRLLTRINVAFSAMLAVVCIAASVLKLR